MVRWASEIGVAADGEIGGTADEYRWCAGRGVRLPVDVQRQLHALLDACHVIPLVCFERESLDAVANAGFDPRVQFSVHPMVDSEPRR